MAGRHQNGYSNSNNAYNNIRQPRPSAPPHPNRARELQDRLTHTLRIRRAQHPNKPDYSAVSPCVKYFLFVINFLFLVVGSALAAAGIYVLVLKSKTVTSFIDFIFDPGCDLCLIGLIVFFIALFACWGALREFIALLRTYYVLMSIFLLLELVLLAFVIVFSYYDGAFAKIGLYPEDAILDAVKYYRDDPDMKDFIDGIQELLSCCGASNDDNGYLDWNKNLYFNCTTGNPSPESCNVPFSCCVQRVGSNRNTECGRNVLGSNAANLSAINTQGCLKALQSIITDNTWTVFGSVVGIFIPQAIFIFLAKTLVSEIQEQMAKW
ncbi:hypothetical protein BsWGS_04101 [Bradybaena similaris]